MKNRNNNDSFLLLSGFCPDTRLLTNQKLLYNILGMLPELIDMKSIRKPIISIAEGNPGLEGYIPIDTSNITISTYTKNPRIVACVYSCKEFNHEKVLDYLKEKYNCSNMKFLYCHESDFSS